jgi:hypothetical protein
MMDVSMHALAGQLLLNRDPLIPTAVVR